MNPRVVKYAGQVGFDAGRYTWFDLTDLPDGYEDEFNAYSRSAGLDVANWSMQDLPLPSENLAVIPKNEVNDRDVQFIITYNKELTIGKYVGPGICAWIADHPDPIPAAVLVNSYDDITESHLHVRPDFRESFEKNPTETKKMYQVLRETMMNKPIISVVVLNHKAFVNKSNLAAYRGTDNKPFINKKRRAKNRPPVYDWVTVEIAPSPPRKESLGGTHASPARHERRGHYRRYPSGKIAWVRPTWVGSIERGLIVHDYVPETV